MSSHLHTIETLQQEERGGRSEKESGVSSIRHQEPNWLSSVICSLQVCLTHTASKREQTHTHTHTHTQLARTSQVGGGREQPSSRIQHAKEEGG